MITDIHIMITDIIIIITHIQRGEIRLDNKQEKIFRIYLLSDQQQQQN